AVLAAGEARPLGEQEINDGLEGDRGDGEEMPRQAQRGDAEQKPEGAGRQYAEREGLPEIEAEVAMKDRRGVGTDTVECALREGVLTAIAHHEVEPRSQDHV